MSYCSFECERVCEHSQLFEKVRQDADQLRAAELIARQPVVVMSGKGGCGKTEVVSAVVSYAVAQINSEKYVSMSWHFVENDLFPVTLKDIQINVTLSEVSDFT